MLTSQDFRDLLKSFEKHKVRYLIVGGYAVMKYSELRFTKDLDIFIATNQGNAEGVYSALKEFGAPLENPDFIRSQEASGRLQDKIDVEKLNKTQLVIEYP
jgi:hypothetical protein